MDANNLKYWRDIVHQSAYTHAQITTYIDIMYSTWDMSRTNARSCEITFEILINSCLSCIRLQTQNEGMLC